MSAIDYWDALGEAEQVGIPADAPVVFKTRKERLEARVRNVVNPSKGHHAHYCERCDRIHYYWRKGECAE